MDAIRQADVMTAATGTVAVPRLCHTIFEPEAYQLPSLPKPGKTLLVATKLCQQALCKLTTRHEFDATTPREYTKPILMEYNSLHDPHLKSYFYRPEMMTKLVHNGLVTKDLGVVVPLKVYNAYRKYMENEYLKIHGEKLDQNPPITLPQVKETSTVKNLEREEKRRLYFQEQEETRKAKQLEMQQQVLNDQIEKERALKVKTIRQQKWNAKREAEREQQCLLKKQKEDEESQKRKEILNKTEAFQKMRLVRLQETKEKKQKDRISTLKSRQQKYEEHARLVHQKEEEEKSKEHELKMERVRRRSTLFMVLQKREEEKKHKLMENNRKMSDELKREADDFERQWKELHDQEKQDCRERIERQRQFWLRRVSRLPSVSQQQRNSSASGNKFIFYYQRKGSAMNASAESKPVNFLPAITEQLSSAESVKAAAVTESEAQCSYNQQCNKKKVHFGDDECIVGGSLSSVNSSEHQYD